MKIYSVPICCGNRDKSSWPASKLFSKTMSAHILFLKDYKTVDCS